MLFLAAHSRPTCSLAKQKLIFPLYLFLFACACSRDESLDSGIHSHDSTTSDHQQMEHPPVPMRRTIQQRSRRLEMIPIPGRNKFEIRDLNEFSEETVVVPLSLPKLPTDRNEIVTNGLIRSTNSNYNAESDMDMSISGDSRPTSFISTASDAESFEEEKQKLDISSSEKSSKVFAGFSLIM